MSPNGPRSRILRALARLGGATSADLAGHLYRPPKCGPRAGTYAEKLAVETAWRADCARARQNAQRAIEGRLRELTREGYVEPAGAPRVAQWVLERWTMRERAPWWRGLGIGAQALLARLVEAEHTGSPLSRADLGRSGAAGRSYRALVEAELIVPPSLRLLSGSGWALLRTWGDA